MRDTFFISFKMYLCTVTCEWNKNNTPRSYNVRSVKKDTKRSSSNTLLCLLSFFTEQTLWGNTVIANKLGVLLVSLVEEVTWLHCFHLKEMNPKCTLVHCNDGVGPTGTFIALSKLIDKIHSNAQKLNVFQTVLDLRKERKYMVRNINYCFFIGSAVD